MAVTRVLPQGESELPPAGDARREVLRERADDLAQKAEELGAEGGAISPEALEIEPEIGRFFNELEVPNARSDSRYCWVQCSASWHGRFVNQKRAQGWEIVRPSDDDAPSDTGQVDGTCRVGDVLLMRIRADRYLMLKRAQEKRQRAIEGSTEAELQQMGDKYAQFGVSVSVNDPARIKQMAARGIAMKGIDGMIRAGTVPGMPRPGAR